MHGIEKEGGEGERNESICRQVRFWTDSENKKKLENERKNRASKEQLGKEVFSELPINGQLYSLNERNFQWLTSKSETITMYSRK